MEKMIHEGKILVHPQGFAFVEVTDLDEDIFIPPGFLGSALYKDIVEVEITDQRNQNKRTEGRVVNVIERGISELVGTFYFDDEELLVIADDARYSARITVDDSKEAQDEYKVRVRVTEYLDSGEVLAEIIEIIGHKNTPGVDILSVTAKHDIESDFSDATLAEAEAIPDVPSPEDYKGRRDLRDEMIVTIDGADAKDLDDAVGVKLLDNGNYLLTVSIADVSHYIKEGSALDNDAYSRATSVYLTDRVIPMIPSRLSNGICSLNPKVDRLTLTCQIEISPVGLVLGSEVFASVIKTKERMTYKDVNLILAGDFALRSKYKELAPMFEMMNELANLLRERRTSRGAIEFDTKEAKILVDEYGKPTDVVLRERGISEKIIEDFMLAANEAVAERFHWMDVPFIYRIHENPKPDRILNFYKLARTLGYKIKGNRDEIHPKSLQKTLEDAQGTKEADIISKMMLRSMEKARYADESLGHFGLAAQFYTHFTSPIRRYPDLIVHRLIRKFLIEGDLIASTLDHFERELPEIAKHTSKKERAAIDCEREVTSMKMAEYMEGYIGEEFDGVVAGVTKWGIYVELPNTIEGLIRLGDMRDDFYDFNEDMMMIVGRRQKKSFRLGDAVRVRVKSADKEERIIDFHLTSGGFKHKEQKGVRNSDKGRGKKQSRRDNHKGQRRSKRK